MTIKVSSWSIASITQSAEVFGMRHRFTSFVNIRSEDNEPNFPLPGDRYNTYFSRSKNQKSFKSKVKTLGAPFDSSV